MRLFEHRQNVEFVGVDEYGHEGFQCRCCSEVFSFNMWPRIVLL